MTPLKAPYIQPDVQLIATAPRSIILGTAENPGGTIDDFTFDTKEMNQWQTDNEDSDI